MIKFIFPLDGGDANGSRFTFFNQFFLYTCITTTSFCLCCFSCAFICLFASSFCCLFSSACLLSFSSCLLFSAALVFFLALCSACYCFSSTWSLASASCLCFMSSCLYLSLLESDIKAELIVDCDNIIVKDQERKFHRAGF